LAHEGHSVKSLQHILHSAEQDKNRLVEEIKEQEQNVTKAISFLKGISEVTTE